MSVSGQLSVTVVTPNGDRHPIEAPANIGVEDFVKQIVTGLSLQTVAADGSPTIWSIKDHDTSRTLDEQKTLEENGVIDGQCLLIFPERSALDKQSDQPSNEIRIIVVTPSSCEHPIDVPADMNTKRFLQELVTALMLPSMDAEGKQVDWAIDDKDTGKTLAFGRTLRENGVRDGHRLYVHRQVVAGGKPEMVLLKIFHPGAIKPRVFYELLAYVFVADAGGEVESHARSRLGNNMQNYSRGVALPTQEIQRGARITVVPRLAGCTFHPREISFDWTENWHCAEFQLEASSEFGGATVRGSVAFYVGPILIGEVEWTSNITPFTKSSLIDIGSSLGLPYSAIFVSYSHRDMEIVEGLEKAYTALGMKYLRDVHELRSGEKWNEALLAKIEEAQIFQLCWSNAAKSSQNVEREWRHALKQERSYFIRPVYWETPLPSPPQELGAIHFAYLDLGVKRGLFQRARKRVQLWLRKE